MDAPLNTSVILLVAVALWLIWVAPYMLRGRKRALAADAAPTVPQSAVAFPAVPAPRQQVSMYMQTKQSQEIQMKTTSTSPAAVPSAKPLPSNPKSLNSAKHPLKSPAPLKIHYGRTFIALVALLALLATVVSGLLRLLGMASGLIPVGAAVVFIGCLALLRALTVRSRKARLNAAFRTAMGPTTTAASRLAPRPSDSAGREAASTGRAATSAGMADAARAAAADRPAVAVFDAAAGGSAAPAAPVRAVKPLTAAELRSAALAVAAKGAADAQVATTETVGELETWQPVEVPKPSYVAAAKADRPAPAPLELPEAPKPSGKTSIKATEAAAVVSKATEAAEAEKAAADTAASGAATGTSAETAAAPDRALSSGQAPAPAGKARPMHGLSNLDDVLQRRRA
ncbi:MAG: hypothetical protein M3017_03480 [Actinomycetota bacterium]|nr:hypothetical protein [Actinomycetota bacterium]